MNLADPEQSARFVQLLTGMQSRLYAYLCTLLGRSHEARDVLQETNLVLWKKAADFDAARPFEAWAIQFARFQAMAWRKRQSRDRLVFDDTAFDFLAGESSRAGTGADDELRALENCLRKLPERSRTLLSRRYSENVSVNELALAEECAPNALAALLYRARKVLADCVRGTLNAGEGAA